jgi:hypothetical protein
MKNVRVARNNWGILLSTHGTCNEGQTQGLHSLSPLQPSVPCTTLYSSTALCPPYGPMFPLRPYVLSSGSMSSLQPFVPCVALCPLYGSLFPIQPSVPSTTYCPLYSPLSPLRPYVLVRNGESWAQPACLGEWKMCEKKEWIVILLCSMCRVELLWCLLVHWWEATQTAEGDRCETWTVAINSKIPSWVWQQDACS